MPEWRIQLAEGSRDVCSIATFTRWVSCGERDDYVAVSLQPPLEPEAWGLNSRVEEAILAPRHLGFSLRTGPFPLHAYLTTTTKYPVPETVDPDDLTVRAWIIASKSPPDQTA